MKKQAIYFVHSNRINYNEEMYLPVLRSNYLSNYDLIFPNSKDNMNVYYKDLLKKSDFLVVNLTYSDTGLSIVINDAVKTSKPILAVARKDVGFDAKYQKIIKNVVGYQTEEEFRNIVETFIKSYEGKIIGGQVDPTIVLGTLN